MAAAAAADFGATAPVSVAGSDPASSTLLATMSPSDLAATQAGADVSPASSLARRLASIESDGLQDGKRSLELSDAPVGNEGAEQLVRGLATNTGLRQLHLQRCQLTAPAFDAIGRLLCDGARAAKTQASAQRRIAAGFPATEQELAGGSAHALKELILSGNECGPEGMCESLREGLRSSMYLRVLSLGSCNLGDAGAALLCDVLTYRDQGDGPGCLLEKLDLSSNGLGPPAASHLAHALGVNQKLQSLDLKANLFGRDGAKAIAELIRANKGRLKRLDVSQNALQFEGVRTVVEQFVRPIDFTAQIMRPVGQTVGLGLDSDMRVMGVNPASPVERWNEAHLSEAIFPNDRLLRVNDKKEANAMLKELAEVQRLELQLHRPDISMEYIDLCHNSVQLSGVEEIRLSLGKLEVEGSMRGGIIDVGGGRRVNLNAF